MRAIAEFVMRGRTYAAAVTFFASILPLLNWLASATVGLVVLRKGPVEGLIILMWGLMPLGIAFYYLGDPSPLITMVSTTVLAYVLRVTVSWEATLAVAVLLSVTGSLIFELTAADILASIVEWYLDYTKQIAQQLQQTSDISFAAAKNSIMGFFAMGQAYAMLAFLILARWWQSTLYNPGGFQTEFHQMRLSPLLSCVVVALILVCVAFYDQFGRWLPVLTVPLTMAGLGFVHWAIKLRQMSGNWVFGFYVMLVVGFQILYPFLVSLALMDSLFNLRTRILKQKDN